MRLKIYLFLVFSLLVNGSLQLNCFYAANTRIIQGDISKFLPSYKNIGNAEKTYICTPNTLCFNSPKQFYKYYGLLKSRSECVCEDGFKKQCVLDAEEKDNKGIRSVFLDNEFYGNEEFSYSKVVVIFLLRSRRIGETQRIYEWYLGSAYPLK